MPACTPQTDQNEDWSAVARFFGDIPPVTRTLLIGTFLATFLSAKGFISIQLFIIDWHAIIYRFQIWRMFLTVFHAGGLGFGFLMHIYFIYIYSRQLERNIFCGRISNYCWMLTICLGMILALQVPLGHFLAGPSLVVAMIHVWGRHAGPAKVSLYGVLEIPAKYLSIAMVFLSYAMGVHMFMGNLAGLLAGHSYYWLDSIYPLTPGGRNVIVVPDWFERLIGFIQNAGETAIARASGNPATTSGSSTTAPNGSATGSRSAGITRPTVRHTWGSGRTLGSS